MSSMASKRKKNRATRLGIEDTLRGYNKGKTSFHYNNETRISKYTIVLKSLVIDQLERDEVLSRESNSQHLNICRRVEVGGEIQYHLMGLHTHQGHKSELLITITVLTTANMV